MLPCIYIQCEIWLVAAVSPGFIPPATYKSFLGIPVVYTWKKNKKVKKRTDSKGRQETQYKS